MNNSNSKTEKMEASARYLYGEMSAQEAKGFEEAVAADQDHMNFIETMKQQQEHIDAHLNQPQPNVDEAWGTLYQRLANDSLLAEPDNRPSPALRANPWIRMAAAIALLVAVGSIALITILGLGSTTITTSAADQGSLVQSLPDGSVVYIAPGTELTIPSRILGSTRKVELKGSAYFDIANDPSKPFHIKTDAALVEVLGTSFNLKSTEKDNFELMVESGTVRVSQHTERVHSEIVTAGEWIELQQQRFVKGLLADRNYPGWQAERLQFKDTPLGSIMEVLNRNYGSVFITADPTLTDRKLTITVHNDPPEAIADIISRALNLRADVKNDTITLSN